MAKKILVVEDDKDIRTVLVKKLKLEKFSVSEAKNGKEGLKITKSIKPDLVLLDIQMPVMNGLTYLKKLRAEKWGINIPVIMLTNLSEDEKIAEAVQYNASEYLVKTDWKIKEIAQKIRDKIDS
ncbi:PleD family two-component system response regulator [Patescibacteria group bacterium]